MENQPKKDVQDIILDELRIMQSDVKNIDRKVSALEVKAGIWGTISGAMAAVAITLGFPKSH